MFDSIPEGLPVKQVHPKLSMFLFFVASLGLAVIINVLPSTISMLAYSRQFSSTFSFSGHSDTGSSLANHLQTVYNNDLCSRAFVMMDSRLSAAKNDVSSEQVSHMDRGRSVKFDRSGRINV